VGGQLNLPVKVNQIPRTQPYKEAHE